LHLCGWPRPRQKKKERKKRGEFQYCLVPWGKKRSRSIFCSPNAGGRGEKEKLHLRTNGHVCGGREREKGGRGKRLAIYHATGAHVKKRDAEIVQIPPSK